VPKPIAFSREAWSDYLYWHKYDCALLRRINELLHDCRRDPIAGIGNPKELTGDLNGWWSRRIDYSFRLVYRMKPDKLEVAALR
jgi:toxin YoeB